MQPADLSAALSPQLAAGSFVIHFEARDGTSGDTLWLAVVGHRHADAMLWDLSVDMSDSSGVVDYSTIVTHGIAEGDVVAVVELARACFYQANGLQIGAVSLLK